MALRGTDPESYITEYTLVYEDKAITASQPMVPGNRHWILFFGMYRKVTSLARIPGQSGSQYRGTSPIRKRPPPKDPPRTLGTGLR